MSQKRRRSSADEDEERMEEEYVESSQGTEDSQQDFVEPTQKRAKPGSQDTYAEAGIIKRIELINFLCHEVK